MSELISTSYGYFTREELIDDDWPKKSLRQSCKSFEELGRRLAIEREARVLAVLCDRPVDEIREELLGDTA